MIEDFVDRVTELALLLMDALGAPGAGVAIALENIFPPIPSEVILPLAGFSAAQGRLSLWAVLLATTLGSLVGAGVLYALGALLGRDRLRRIVDKLPLVRVDDLERAERFFARHGAKAVLLGRMVPIVRSLISIPAGVERMPLGLFFGLTALGSAVWNCLLIGAGYLLGNQWSLVEDYVGIFSKIVLVTMVAAAAWWLLGRLRHRMTTPGGPIG